jgi:hypothetical protein
VGEIEAKTGYKFLMSVPSDVRHAVNKTAPAPDDVVVQPEATPQVTPNRRPAPFRGLGALRPGILFPRRIR